VLTGGQFSRRKLIYGQLSEVRCQESQLHNVVSGKYFVTPEHHFAALVHLSMLVIFHIHYCRYEEVNIALASVGIILQTSPAGVSDLTVRNKTSLSVVSLYFRILRRVTSASASN